MLRLHVLQSVLHVYNSCASPYRVCFSEATNQATLTEVVRKTKAQMTEAASVLITFFLLDLHYEKILRFLYKNRPTELPKALHEAHHDTIKTRKLFPDSSQ